MRGKTLLYLNYVTYFGLFVVTAVIRFIGTESFANADEVNLLVLTSAIWAIVEYLLLFSWNLGRMTVKQFQEERN